MLVLLEYLSMFRIMSWRRSVVLRELPSWREAPPLEIDSRVVLAVLGVGDGEYPASVDFVERSEVAHGELLS